MMIPDLTPIERYLRDTGRTPFFLFVGGDGYAAVRGELLSMGLSPLPLSTLCPAADRLPLADDVVAAVRARTAAGAHIVVTGLAEYLALRGVAEAERLMRRLKDLSCGLGAAVLSSAIPMFLEMKALRGLQAGTYGVMTSLEPALTATIAFVTLGESLTWAQWGAIVLTVVAAMGSALTGQRP